MLQVGSSRNMKQSTQPRYLVEALETHWRAVPLGFYWELAQGLGVEVAQSAKPLLPTYRFQLLQVEQHLVLLH